jgi:hypothetical protein
MGFWPPPISNRKAKQHSTAPPKTRDFNEKCLGKNMKIKNNTFSAENDVFKI